MVPENKQNRRYKQINFIGPQNNRHPSQHTVGNVHRASGNSHQNISSRILIVGPSIFVVLLQNNQQIRRGSSSIFINAFMDLPQHVLASHCPHQGVVVSSEATQAVCIVDVYGLRPVQSGQLSRDVTKRVHAWGKSINALIKILLLPRHI
jgi:hypothetical protein